MSIFAMIWYCNCKQQLKTAVVCHAFILARRVAHNTESTCRTYYNV